MTTKRSGFDRHGVYMVKSHHHRFGLGENHAGAHCSVVERLEHALEEHAQVGGGAGLPSAGGVPAAHGEVGVVEQHVVVVRDRPCDRISDTDFSC